MNSVSFNLQESFYVTGGTLRGDAACYVVRSSDEELYDGLRRGEFCCVLTARQMGKSSLMVRTAARLREEGSGVAILDLTAIGQNLDPEQWYGGLINQMGLQLECEDELEDFWDEHLNLGPLQRWRQAVRQVVLPRYSGSVVVFIDEIDSVRSLPFSTDEFFAGIREFYNYRTEDPELERLSFCLLGVASPADLIRDTRTTPFNIGRRIELRDFTESEALQLAEGLDREGKHGQELLCRALHWTGGHPYLTQRLCLTVAEDETAHSARDVDRICEEIFFSRRAREQDDNLLFVRERMLRSEVDLGGLLTLCGQVQRRKRVADDERNPLVTILRLAGITSVENGHLQVRNRIYRHVFDREWVKTNMPDAELRRQQQAYRRGFIRAGAISFLIILLIGFLTLMAVYQRNRAQEETVRADRNAEENRRNLYATHMNLASSDWAEGNLDRIRDILRVHFPGPDQEDLRGFEWYHFWKLCHQDAFTLKHGDGRVLAAFSPDGEIVASANGDSVKLWDTSTGQLIRELNLEPGQVGIMRFHPEGELLAWAGGYGDSGGDNRMRTLRFVEVATGREARVLQIPDLQDISPDFKTLVAAPDEEMMELSDLTTGEEVSKIRVPRRFRVSASAFSKDGKRLALSNHFGHRPLADGRRAQVIIWDVETGTQILRLEGDRPEGNDNLLDLAFSPDGKRLVSGHGTSRGGIVKLWDLRTGQQSLTLEGHRSAVSSVHFSHDGRNVASGSWDRTVRIWDTATGQEIAPLKGHGNRLMSVRYSPDGKKLASGSLDGTAKLWDLEQERVPAELVANQAKSVDFSPDGTRLASSNWDRRMDCTIRIWDTANWREITTIEVRGEGIWSRKVRFFPDGERIVSGDVRTVSIWDASSGRELLRMGQDLGAEGVIAYSPDGSKIASPTRRDKTVKLFDSATGQELLTLEGYPNRVYCLAFSPGGKSLASGTIKSMIKVWDVTTGEEIFTHQEVSGEVFSLAYSPDGRLLASGSYGTVKLWDTDGYKVVRELEGHAGNIKAMEFSPDGTRLATASQNGNTRLWNVTTGRELISITVPPGNGTGVSFSADGQSLAIAHGKGISVWRISTEDEVQRRREREG